LSLSLLHTVRRLLVALPNFLNAIAGHRQEALGIGIFGIKTSEPVSGVRDSHHVLDVSKTFGLR
jgi:hypothetical protein